MKKKSKDRRNLGNTWSSKIIKVSEDTREQSMKTCVDTTMNFFKNKGHGLFDSKGKNS